MKLKETPFCEMLHLFEVENGNEDFELHAQQRGTTGKHVTEAAKSIMSAAFLHQNYNLLG